MMMDLLERMALGVLIDLSTNSNFFLIFLQSLHYCYLKVFPGTWFELKWSAIALVYIFTGIDLRIPAFFIYFGSARATMSLGSTESLLVASLATIPVLNYSTILLPLFPVLAQLLLFMLILTIPNTDWFFLLYDKILLAIVTVLVFVERSAFIFDNIQFIIYWSLVSIIGLSIIFTANYMKIGKMIQRKLFHFLLLAIYIPGLSNPILTSFVSLSVLYILIGLEVIRPKVPSLNNFFLKFTDERDSEDLIVTHIYLLSGFSFPFVFSIIFKNDLLAWSGIISLGIGDTFACLIGYYLGQIPLPYRKKTIEGTLGGFISMCIFCSYYNLLTPYMTSSLLLISLYEAYTQKIDNLVLPILAFSLFSLANK